MTDEKQLEEMAVVLARDGVLTAYQATKLIATIREQLEKLDKVQALLDKEGQESDAKDAEIERLNQTIEGLEGLRDFNAKEISRLKSELGTNAEAFSVVLRKKDEEIERFMGLVESSEHWLSCPPTSNSDRHCVGELVKKLRAALRPAGEVKDEDEVFAVFCEYCNCRFSGEACDCCARTPSKEAPDA